MMDTYTVTVTREDNLWVAVVDGLPQGVVGAADFEHFSDIHEDMRELIADLTDADPSDFTVEWRYELAGDVTALVTEYLEAGREADRVEGWRDAARAALLRRLNGPLSQRALADLVGVSHQRINQLVKS